MDAPTVLLVHLLITLVHLSHQWTSHGSVQFLTEGESTLLEAPGDSSAGCKWTFTHSDTGHSCCFASHPYFCDRVRNKLNLCREMADTKVNTEVSGVPGCTLALNDLSEKRDKGNYKVTFPANINQGLEVSLWIYPPPVPVTTNQPVVVDPQERREKCWGWGECHPSVVNREDFDCSICPTEDPSTWKADDVHFEVTCDGDVGNLSFKLDDLLETNWLESLSLQLVYSTSNGEDVRVPVISTTGTTKKHHVAAKTRLCLSFDPGLSPTICGSCGATLAPTGTLRHNYMMYSWATMWSGECGAEEFVQFNGKGLCMTPPWDNKEKRDKLWCVCNRPGREIGTLLLYGIADTTDSAMPEGSTGCAREDVVNIRDTLREGHQTVAGIQIYALLSDGGEDAPEHKRMESLLWYNQNCAKTPDEKIDGVAVNNEDYPRGTAEEKVAFLTNLSKIGAKAGSELKTHFSTNGC